VWSTATWACLQTVRAYPAESPQHVVNLAVSGPALGGGSVSYRDPHSLAEDSECEARVWELETREPLHTLRQAAGHDVGGLKGQGGGGSFPTWPACSSRPRSGPEPMLRALLGAGE
jgi:hypothetical protein